MNIYFSYVYEAFSEVVGCDIEEIEKEDLISIYANDDEVEQIREELQYRIEQEVILDYENLETIQDFVNQIEEIIEGDYEW